MIWYTPAPIKIEQTVAPTEELATPDGLEKDYAYDDEEEEGEIGEFEGRWKR